MRINHFLGGLLAALALNNLHAQDTAPPKVEAKAENKTAVTPVDGPGQPFRMGHRALAANGC